eukprot:366470-Chlamydomonas_euryale.AAC.1
MAGQPSSGLSPLGKAWSEAGRRAHSRLRIAGVMCSMPGWRNPPPSLAAAADAAAAAASGARPGCADGGSESCVSRSSAARRPGSGRRRPSGGLLPGGLLLLGGLLATDAGIGLHRSTRAATATATAAARGGSLGVRHGTRAGTPCGRLAAYGARVWAAGGVGSEASSITMGDSGGGRWPRAEPGGLKSATAGAATIGEAGWPSTRRRLLPPLVRSPGTPDGRAKARGTGTPPQPEAAVLPRPHSGSSIAGGHRSIGAACHRAGCITDAGAAPVQNCMALASLAAGRCCRDAGAAPVQNSMTLASLAAGRCCRDAGAAPVQNSTTLASLAAGRCCTDAGAAPVQNSMTLASLAAGRCCTDAGAAPAQNSMALATLADGQCRDGADATSVLTLATLQSLLAR